MITNFLPGFPAEKKEKNYSENYNLINIFIYLKELEQIKQTF